LTAATREPVQPFPGLRPFSESEVDLFFGREAQSAEIVATLARNRFVAVLGNSGSGKSSLVTAGVLPGLRAGLLAEAGERWIFVSMRPGNDPIGSLLVGLQAAGFCRDANHDDLRSDPLAILNRIRATFQSGQIKRSNVLILADQFEELFRYTARAESPIVDHDEKAAFVSLLLTTVSHDLAVEPGATVYGAITMRSDYLGECAQFRQLAETMNRVQYLVPRMTRDQLRQTIEGPIAMSGGRIAPLLVQRLLNDAGENPDQLPLLQHALMRTWQHWFDRREWQTEISEDDYVQIGTMQDALSKHANEACDEAVSEALARGGLQADQNGFTIVKRIFQRLRERDDKGRETRRPTGIAELCRVSDASFDQVVAVAECFRRRGRTFLTPFEDPLIEDTVIDVTHECLLRKWDRLAGEWALEEEESRRIYLTLATRNPDDYLRGAVLSRAQEWWTRRQPNRDWAMRYHSGFEQTQALLEGSVRRHEDELRHQEALRKDEEDRRIEQARREKQAQQARKRVAYVLAAAALVIALLSAYAYTQLRAKSRLAAAQLLASEAAVAMQTDGLLKTSALLAVESYRRSPNAEALSILSAALTLLPRPLGAVAGPNVQTSIAAYSPNGKLIAVANGGEVLLLDRTTGAINHRLQHPGLVQAIQFGRDRLLTLAADGQVRLWPFDSFKQPDTFSCGVAKAVSMTPDGRTAVCASAAPRGSAEGPRITLWRRNPKSPTPDTQSQTLPHHLREFADISLSMTGSRLAVVSGNQIWVTETFSEKPKTFPPWSSSDRLLRVTPSLEDDDGFYFADETGNVRTWSEEHVGVVLQISSTPKVLAIGSDRLLAVGGSDGAVKVWDTALGIERVRAVISGGVSAISIAPEEDEMVLVGADHRPQRYSLHTSVIIPVPEAMGGRFSPGGDLAIVNSDRTVIADLKNRVEIEVPAKGALPVAFAPGNARVLEFRQQNASVSSWGISDFSKLQLGNRNCVLDIPPLRPGTEAFAFSPDGRWLAAYLHSRVQSERTGMSGLRVWDAATCKLAAQIEFDAETAPFAFTPDSKSVVFAHGDKLARLNIAANTATQLAEMSGSDVNDMRFTRDGQTFAAAATGPRDVALFRWPAMQSLGNLSFAGTPLAMAFNGDGTALAIVSTDRSVHMRHLPDGAEICRFRAGWPIYALTFTPEGAVAVLTDFGISIWRWRFENLSRDLCGRVDGALTQEEWAQYVPSEDFRRTCQ
jgi:WD40 repeat protein